MPWQSMAFLEIIMVALVYWVLRRFLAVSMVPSGTLTSSPWLAPTRGCQLATEANVNIGAVTEAGINLDASSQVIDLGAFRLPPVLDT